MSSRSRWKIGKNFVDAHIGSEVFEHVGHGHAHPPRARLSAKLAGLDSDAERQSDMHER